MFDKFLPRKAQANLAKIGQTELGTNFYLAGGAALTLHLGHRLSHDLDFFTDTPFPPDMPRRELAPLGELAVTQENEGTFLGEFERKFTGVNFSRAHLLKSLVYFDDAEGDEMPEMLEEISWTEVKRFFVQETRRLWRELGGHG